MVGVSGFRVQSSGFSRVQGIRVDGVHLAGPWSFVI